MPQIRPITDLRNTNVYQMPISEAEEEYEVTGILLDAKETLVSLRRKYFVCECKPINVRRGWQDKRFYWV